MVNLLWLASIDNLEDISIRIINKHADLSKEYKTTKANRQHNPFVFYRALKLKKKIKIIEEILQNFHEKNPNIMGKLTPLHAAAKNGHMNICRMIASHLDDKNPRTNSGITPKDLMKEYVKNVQEEADDLFQ